MVTGFYSYATDKECPEKTETMEQYDADRCCGFERVYGRKHRLCENTWAVLFGANSSKNDAF